MKKQIKKIEVLERFLSESDFVAALAVVPADEKEAVTRGLFAFSKAAGFGSPVRGVVYRLPDENGNVRIGAVPVGKASERDVCAVVCACAVRAGLRVEAREDDFLLCP